MKRRDLSWLPLVLLLGIVAAVIVGCGPHTKTVTHTTTVGVKTVYRATEHAPPSPAPPGVTEIDRRHYFVKYGYEANATHVCSYSLGVAHWQDQRDGVLISCTYDNPKYKFGYSVPAKP